MNSNTNKVRLTRHLFFFIHSRVNEQTKQKKEVNKTPVDKTLAKQRQTEAWLNHKT
jgi:hypothetical protein